MILLLEEAEGTWYIPNHEVYHPKKNMLRVVFEYDSMYQGMSLNSVNLQVLGLANSLIGVLLRFRQKHITVMVEIRSMFHQIRVSKSYVGLLHFLWWPDGGIEQDHAGTLVWSCSAPKLCLFCPAKNC